MNSITPRPNFHGPDDFVEHVAACVASGHEPFAPATIAELHAALEAFPDFARRWLPPAEDCERFGIDPTIGQPVEPLTDREQERFLVTLADDDDFRVAVRTLLFGKGAA
jgi:hypothetical protein